MRDIETIDSELRLIAALPRTAAEMGAPMPSIELADQLLDEWSASATSGQIARRGQTAFFVN
jgi:hypothetical protein